MKAKGSASFLHFGQISIICMHAHLSVSLCVYLYILAEANIQSDIQVQFGLSALLKGTLEDFSPSQLRDSNQQL